MQKQQHNKTPKNQQRLRKNQSQGHTPTKNGRQEFERYWTRDEVGRGIKLGKVFTGPIRINPKNYKDAYVPQPDAKADVFISGMEDRNRALNTDVVVVEPFPVVMWRVSLEDFDQYQELMADHEEHKSKHKGSADNGGGGSGSVVKEGSSNKGSQQLTGDGYNSDDSGPDVVIESDSDDGGGGGAAAAMSKLTLDHPHAESQTEKVTKALEKLNNLQDTKPDVQDKKTKGQDTKPDGQDKKTKGQDTKPEGQDKKTKGQDTKPDGQDKKTKGQDKKPDGQSGKLSKASRGKPLATNGRRFMTVAEIRKEASKTGNRLAMDLFGEGLQEAVAVFGIGESLASRFLQVTGKVVAIYEAKHCRAASGHIKPMADNNKSLALFAPSDSRIPRIIMPIAACPAGFLERPKDYDSTLFICRIEKWEETSKMPWGTLARSIGEAGQIEPETEAMLMELDIDDTPFSNEVLQCLPQALPWTIPQEEFSYRRDLRKMCIFTIDPATARDLDDAVSIERKADGTYEVGVHIADVSFFVKEGTVLDEVAAKRATSVYLVQKVVPMLPRLLCEELCSLNPDEDRLAFSVMWTINDQGEILDEWFGRSVIRSCVKLSYEHAQGFIEEPEKKWTQQELPPITNSFKVKDVQERVLQLHRIAVVLRQRRHDSGALRLDQVKLQYSLDKESGLPNGYSVYQQRDSNKLIEEFMLLANMAVAHRIKGRYPKKAILRRHPPPQVKPLQNVADVCENLGLKIDFGTAGSLQKSIIKYSGGHDEESLARILVLVNLLSKPMQNAKYFCTGVFEDETMYHHYALNVPLYTHFTSPIRRYADMMVHRLLAASLDYCKVTPLDTPALNNRADHCNDKKLNAKMASDRSCDMFFSIFVKECGPLEEKGMVMAVLDKSFDVLIIKLGVVKRVYLEKLPLMDSAFRKNMKSPELHLVWAADGVCDHRTSHVIRLFTMVDCKLYSESKPLTYSCVIHRPKEESRFQGADASFD